MMLIGRQLLSTDSITDAVCITILITECIILHSKLITHLRNCNLFGGDVTLLKCALNI